jgi:hypothetical protein
MIARGHTSILRTPIQADQMFECQIAIREPCVPDPLGDTLLVRISPYNNEVLLIPSPLVKDESTGRIRCFYEHLIKHRIDLKVNSDNDNKANNENSV